MRSSPAGAESLPHLVERDAETAVLRAAVEAVTRGQGGVVVVDAGAGMGKTALIRRTRAMAVDAGIAVLSARGAELERDFAFGLVRQLFETTLPVDVERRRALFTGAVAAVEPIFDLGEGETGSLFGLFNGLYWLLVSLAESGPLVLVVDDAQWADPSSMRFLGFLARRLDSVAVLLVVATRGGEHDDGGLLDDVLATEDCAHLRLRSLSAAGVTRLVRGTVSGADDAFYEACHVTTAGNPLFVRELVRVLAESPGETAAVVTSAGPEAVRGHVEARLRRQPDEVRRIAQAVAVLGDNTALALVAEQAGVDVATAAVGAERLVRHGFFGAADPPAFAHVVLRDVVHSLVPLAERGAGHDRAARVLAASGAEVAAVASHVLRTLPAERPDRVKVLVAAAAQAWQRGSPQDAGTYLARARQEPPETGLRSEVSRLLGNCEVHRLAIAEADVHLREALALAGTPEQSARCGYSLARFRNACGEIPAALTLLRQVARVMPRDAPAQLGRDVLSELLGVARSDLSAREELVARLAAFRATADRTDPVLAAHLSVEEVFTGGRADDAVALAETALDGNRLTPERSALWSAMNTLLVADRLVEAEQRGQRALRNALERGQLFAVGIVHAYLARISLLRGNLTAADEHVELGTGAVPRPNVALPALDAARVHLLVERGRLDEARAVLDDGVLADGAMPRASLHTWLLESRMRLHAALGDDEVLLTDAMACGTLYARWGVTGLWDVQWRLHAAAAHRRAGRREQAAVLVAEQLRLARMFGVPRHVATALRAGAGGDLGVLAEAVRLLREGPARLELAEALAELGEARQRGGDRAGARATTKEAAEIALGCRAEALAERLTAGLTVGGGRPPRIEVTGVAALTPSELRVAELAADALTNRQIAENLFVTEKTVETHLGRAYRKLGVRSRTQLAVRMSLR
ncbi:helix-turn-helix transcriptional regulator [Lentzea sp. HUAS TT2]|uniref:helix-turn-helix transcriptional regulator n=1 Tax=Lentzea sp. HUAS TT2 TaxID=3447454 RepID=UPI003F6F72C6